MLPPPFDLSRGVRVSFVDYLRVFYRRRWLAAAVFLAVVVSGAIYTFRTVPVYQAQASILIDVDEPNVIQFPKVLDEAASVANSPQTQHELLKSRALVKRTVETLQLWKRPEFGVSTEDGAIGAVSGGLQIVPIRGTRLVQLRFRWTDPALAAEIVNAHARQYLEQTLEKRFTASKEATDWLGKQLESEEKRVQEVDAALQTYREQHDSLSLDQGQNMVVQKLADLNAGVTKAKIDRIEKETQYRELLAAQKDTASLGAFPAILENSFIQQLKADSATLQREYAQLSETLGELHPTMVEKRKALETADKRITAEIDRVVRSVSTAYHSALAEEESLTKALNEQKGESLSLSRRGIEYAALQREAESVRLVYQALLQRAKETAVSRELRSTNVQIVDPATTPQRPVLPRVQLQMITSFGLGALLAIGTVFLVELGDDRIKLPDDVTRALGQSVLALVPEVRSKRSGRVSLAESSPPRELVEGFRTLRTSVMTALAAETRRSVLVASSAQNEGKTHVAANLAIALAQAQQRVLLIDADLRRPSVHEQTGQRRDPGLSNLLAGTAALTDALQESSVEGLTILSAGRPSDSAPELLGSSVFEKLLAVMEEHFDWVIIDSPPTLTVTDASLIARRTTATLFVIGSAMTRTAAARLAVDQLQRVGGRVIGTVLNRADISQHPFYFAHYASSDYLKSVEESSGERAPAAESL